MKYTRYNYKKNNSANLLMSTMLIIIFSVIIGGITYFMFTQGGSLIDTTSQENDTTQVNQNKDSNDTFSIIQCGIYAKKENADVTLASIPKNFYPFIIELDGKYKVIAGIFGNQLAQEKTTELTNASIENFAVKCRFAGNSKDEEIEIKVLAAYIEIINKLYETDVKSINTKEFKEWTIETSKSSDNKNEELNEILEKIQGLPDEYTKDNIKDEQKFIYNLIIKYKI